MAFISFSFHLSSTTFSQFHPLGAFSARYPGPTKNLKPNLLFPKLKFSPTPPRKFTINSIEISKEDTPPTSSESEDQNSDKRRLEEKFAVLNTGIYECRSCGYKYDEGVGDPSYPIPPGFPFDKLPDDWRCPTCGAAQGFFESKSVEIAGFAENQQYGLGGNSLTSGQKTIVIYGSLLFFFTLFLSGYFIQ